MKPSESNPRFRQDVPQEMALLDHRDLRDDEFWRAIPHMLSSAETSLTTIVFRAETA